MPIEIRAAKHGDEASLVELTAIVHEMHLAAEPECFKPMDPSEMTEWFVARIDNPQTSIWIAEAAGDAIGCLVASLVEQPESPFRPARRYLELMQMVVRPAWRRRGVARALVQVLVSHAAREHIREIELTSWSFNQAAQRAFAQLGFSPRHVRFVRLAEEPPSDRRGE